MAAALWAAPMTAWGADATNPPDYGGVGDWLGTPGDDNYTNAGTVNGSVILQEGNDSFLNTPTGDVDGDVRGAGGNDTLTNEGRVRGDLRGGGDDDTIVNRGTIDDFLTGQDGNDRITNTAAGNVGREIRGNAGNDTIVNHGTVGLYILGGPGSDAITNTGTVTGEIWGTVNGGGGNAIDNPGAADLIAGSVNRMNFSIGGGNRITNSGMVIFDGVYGSVNLGRRSEGGSNTISNPGRAGALFGSLNIGRGSRGGENTIVNSGIVDGDIFSSINSGVNSRGGGNTIVNSGTVGGDIFGSLDIGGTSLNSPGNTITNSGAVGGGIFAGRGNDTVIIQAGSSIAGGVDLEQGDDILALQSNGVFGAAPDGGAGFDTIRLEGGAWAPADVAPPFFINFEDLLIQATGDLTLLGDWDTGAHAATVDGGTLNVSGSLTAPALNIVSGTANISGTAAIGGATTVGGILNVGGRLTTGTLSILPGGVADITGRLDAGAVTNGGRLGINGTLSGAVTNNGWLTGAGRINGSLVNNGTVSPGNSIGTLTVGGAFTNNPGGVYLAEIAANGSSDRIQVLGPATLKGGKVRTDLPRALYPAGFDWTILTAGGGITGAFAAVDGQPDSRTLRLDLVTTSDAVRLSVERSSYGDFGGRDGDRATGRGLDAAVPLAAGTGSAMESFLTAMDFDYTAAQIGQVLAAINPEFYTAFAAAQSQSALRFAAGLTRRTVRLREARRLGGGDPPAEGGRTTGRHWFENDWQVWGRAGGSWTRRRESATYGGHELTAGTVVVGADGRVLPWLRLGLALGSDRTDAKGERDGASGDQEGILAGIYAAADTAGPFYADASISYGSTENDGQRTLELPAATLPAGADFDGESWLVHLGGGHETAAGGWRVGPTAALSYLHAATGGFTETGAGPLSLAVDETTSDRWLSALGVRAATRWEKDGVIWLPRLELVWSHDFQGGEHDLTASFRDMPGAAFTVTGAGLAEDLLTAEAGVTVRVGDRLSAWADLGAGVGEDVERWGLSAGLEWLF